MSKAGIATEAIKRRRVTVKQPSDPAIRFIPLTRGKVAIVDADIYDHLMQWNWYAHQSNGNFYARRNGFVNEPAKFVFMHNVIMPPPAGFQVDHSDPSQSLDNRRSNLRLATLAQQQRNKRRQRNNTSGKKGVTWRKQRQRWFAYIWVNRRMINLGLYVDFEDAVKARLEAEPKYHGEFARAR